MMKEFFKDNWVSLVLYGLFGLLLGMSGVSITEKPFYFWALTSILVVIDLRSHNQGLNKGAEIVKTVWDIK
jgi:site-specific recombinase